MPSPNHNPCGDPCDLCGSPALSHRVSHNPKGDPCSVCHLPARNHRVKHEPDGDPCSCGAGSHVLRITARSKKDRIKRKEHVTPRYFIGVDGEGRGRSDHKYVFLAACDEHNRYKWCVENQEGLSTVQCLEFLLSLPRNRAKLFSYGFNYDITKILTDVEDKRLYILFRPERRQRHGVNALKGPKPVRWLHYDLNLQGTKFTVKCIKTHRRIVIWDVLKFYQSKFVKALDTWKVGDPAVLKNMSHMKDQRADFDRVWEEQPDAARRYCFDECHYMAQLARKLTDAHDEVGLKLTGYFGAGSSATAMLKVMGIKDKLKPTPEDMIHAVAMAFFGGRFECGVIGEFAEKLYSLDISSAYPYQLCFLPCLLHSRWEKTTRREDIDEGTTALVHYELGPITKRHRALFPGNNFDAWGPFPFRTKDGSICFPQSSGGGYVWREEFKAAERLFPNVRFRDAWVCRAECDCRPFDSIPRYYLERLRIGKEGPGIVLKLGSNSCFGKLAQSVGLAPFNSWIWAGLITSGTRAQCLDLLGLHRDWTNLLQFATDGAITREDLERPKPRETGTDREIFDEYEKKIVRKPLGGWEKKVVDDGMFICRPGIYFPLQASQEDEEKMRGRGVGKKTILENRQKIIDGWRKAPQESTIIQVANVSRFMGAKSSISFSETTGFQRSLTYGQWVERTINMSFHPMPKRESLNRDGKTLKLRKMPMDLESMPYRNAVQSADAVNIKALDQEILEQPDGDFAEYEEHGVIGGV